MRVLSRQGGARVICHDNNLVLKQGRRVHYGEEVAARLIKQHTNVPVPVIVFSRYNDKEGTIGMAYVPGYPLDSIWDGLNEQDKERVCHDIWAMIMRWRQIPRPAELAHRYQCLADGSSATRDPLIKDLQNPPRPLNTDEEVRARIYQRYRRCGGDRYADTLPDMLPRCSESVFTHADVAPRNLIVDSTGHITGVIDWEMAGWYPDYWEYANIMKPTNDEDWQGWMDRTAPQRWDLSGISAARRVLF